MKKLYSTLIISSALAFSSASFADQKHYMSHPGDAPQGHMMEGKEHKAGADESHPIAQTTEVTESAAAKQHYMPHAGDGPQGHMMQGNKHTEGATEDHTDQHGNGQHTQPSDKHYMAETGDGPQGQMMKGAKHTQ
jgi:hypothetical protein